MESDRSPIIIEFNGLPGSGKTTVSKLLAEKMEEAGFNVGKANDVFKNYKGRKAIKLFRIIKSIDMLMLWHLFRFLLSVKPFKFSRLKYIKSIYLYFAAYKELYCCEYRSKILVVDQGIIQAIVSVVYLDDLENTTQLKRLLHYIVQRGFNYICVNCILDYNVSSQRVIERGFNQGRFDTMEYTELLRNQGIQSKTFIKVHQIMSELGTTMQIQIDMNQTAEENCDVLYNVILSRIESVI